MKRLRLEAADVRIDLELGDSATAAALVAAAPFEARAQTWGEELYFSTPVSMPLEPYPRQVVEPGTVCFWTEGDALALPWGRTPISTDARPRLASPCSVLGKVAGDHRELGKIRSGARIRVTAA